MVSGKLLLLPVVAQLISVFSRITLFDYWTWPEGLLVFIGLNLLLTIVAWRILKNAATELRRDALERIEQHLREAEAAG
ncbi:MAG: hypothetical protein HC841_08615, partial [Verrucomicrobiae bacterium]|nr:hypothetical protein [Verrucomicrobiae bacterium]